MITPQGVRGSRVYAIGDSLTANGNQSGNSFIASQSWLMWAVMLSGSKLRYAGVAATGGLTAEQVAATHLPTAVAARPDFCVVTAGTNNLPALVFSTLIATLTQMYTTLRAVGIQPVAGLIPPPSANQASALQVNAWIRQYAAANQIPVVDFHTPLVDAATGSLLAAYQADATHPNGAGAKLMGQALVDALEPLTGESSFSASTINADTNNVANPVNAVFISDSNADGIPNGVSVQTTDGSLATSLVTGDAAIAGSWFRMNKTSGTGLSTYKTAAAPAAASGDRILVCGRMNYLSGSEGTTIAYVELVSDVMVEAPALKWDRFVNAPFALPVITLAHSVTRLQIYMIASAGVMDVRFAQMTILNLTALGVTS